MVMFVLHMDGSHFFNFNIPVQRFKKGERIGHPSLIGEYEVVHLDNCTVTVKPLSVGTI